ncbi:hypothetical protein [uncultured Bacteroides sp.]|uniref:hypothetical protein n=1 Tax=uncultured Bacteroides sp. TaxID=162156 RepID=UPI0026345399|nr:hypothetical protein [uncultured Bacteroides sp.]
MWTADENIPVGSVPFGMEYNVLPSWGLCDLNEYVPADYPYMGNVWMADWENTAAAEITEVDGVYTFKLDNFRQMASDWTTIVEGGSMEYTGTLAKIELPDSDPGFFANKTIKENIALRKAGVKKANNPWGARYARMIK